MTTWKSLRSELASSEYKRPHHAANQVLRRMRVELPTVPVETMATSMGFVIKPLVSGSVAVLDAYETWDAPFLWIRGDIEAIRRRFAVAHALGHLLRHPLGRYIDHAYTPSSDPSENDASEFAINLLCPLWMLEPIVGYSMRSPENLCEVFGVSMNLLERQLKKLL